MSDAADALETLTRERDEAERLLDLTVKQRDQANGEANEAECERDALRALLREAGEALEPFSAWCDSMEQFAKGLSNGLSNEARVASDLTMGDARRARAVLARIKEGLNDSK